ncbi:MAG: hypothetical protein AB7K37_12430 [Cyclobacteriaceae bacterium]
MESSCCSPPRAGSLDARWLFLDEVQLRYLAFTEGTMEEDIKKVVAGLAGKSRMGNVMELLNWPASRFDEGFALALEMQNRDLVKLLYSNFNQNKIVVEITLVGEAYLKR